MGRYAFYVFLLIALAVHIAPFSDRIAAWAGFCFYQIDVALGTLVTGGRVARLVLTASGQAAPQVSGSAYGWLPAFVGYGGLFLWGALLYRGASPAGGLSTRWCAVVGAVVLVAGALWVRDPLTIAVMGVVAALCFAAWAMPAVGLLRMAVQLLGAIVIVAGFYWPLAALIHGRNVADAASLAAYTGLPAGAWALIWAGIGIVTLDVIRRRGG